MMLRVVLGNKTKTATRAPTIAPTGDEESFEDPDGEPDGVSDGEPGSWCTSPAPPFVGAADASNVEDEVQMFPPSTTAASLVPSLEEVMPHQF